MPKNLYSIRKEDLFDLFDRLSADHRVIVPYAAAERLYFGEFDLERREAIELGGIRQSEPFKTFLNPPREKVLNGPRQDARPVIVAGVKACDLSSLVLQDFVFLKGDLEDPFYAANRKNVTIIASDCTYAKETCFCLAMNGAPYPKKDFDLSLSSADDRFLVDVGTQKGAALIDGFKAFFKETSAASVEARQKRRDGVTAQVGEFIDKRGTPNTDRIRGTVKKNYNSVEFWRDFSSTCVECGACNLVCPTCHCFLLFDDRSGNGLKNRNRIWDACLYKSFARVAGGANPRKHLYERLRNRFDKKFDFFPQTLDYFACTGCGRCIEACPGDIDIREVLKGLVNGKWNKPPNK